MFHHVCVETLEQVVEGGCGCPITGIAEGQVGWSFEQPGLAKYVHAKNRRRGLIDL